MKKFHGATESLAYDTDDQTSAKESEAKINPRKFFEMGDCAEPLTLTYW